MINKVELTERLLMSTLNLHMYTSTPHTCEHACVHITCTIIQYDNDYNDDDGGGRVNDDGDCHSANDNDGGAGTGDASLSLLQLLWGHWKHFTLRFQGVTSPAQRNPRANG